MVKNEYIPNRGDYVWLNFTPQSGHEQMGKRPAIVISPKEYNEKVGLAIFCPITSKEKAYPFEVKVNLKKIRGVILTDQIKSLDWRTRNIKFISKSTKEELNEVIDKLSLLIF
jgi:mRNA interferase MazF